MPLDQKFRTGPAGSRLLSMDFISGTVTTPTEEEVDAAAIAAHKLANKLDSIITMTPVTGRQLRWLWDHNISRGLDDAGDFEAVIAKQGAELIVHGHNHRASFARIPGPQGSEAPIVGVASASARPGGHHPAAAYHLFEIDRTGRGVRISLRARGVDAAGEIVETPATII